MEASSTINQPHPDDEAEGFFGADEQDGEPVEDDTKPAPEGDIEPEPEPEPEPKATVPVDEKPVPVDEKRSTIDREYIVFQRVPLTKRALEHMLAEIKAGRAPEPRVAYLELHRPVARNDKLAIAGAYREHRSSLGDECTLASVSARSFRERRVKPRTEPIEERLEIS